MSEFIHGFNSGAYSWIHYLIHSWDHSLTHSLVHLHISQSLFSSFTHSWAHALVDEGADKCAHESRTHKIGHLIMSSPTFSCICELAASPMNSLPHEHSQSWAHGLYGDGTYLLWLWEASLWKFKQTQIHIQNTPSENAAPIFHPKAWGGPQVAWGLATQLQHGRL